MEFKHSYGLSKYKNKFFSQQINIQFYTFRVIGPSLVPHSLRPQSITRNAIDVLSMQNLRNATLNWTLWAKIKVVVCLMRAVDVSSKFLEILCIISCSKLQNFSS